jgi:hypothetical protein
MTVRAVILYIDMNSMENLCLDRGSTAGAVERERINRLYSKNKYAIIQEKKESTW